MTPKDPRSLMDVARPRWPGKGRRIRSLRDERGEDRATEARESRASKLPVASTFSLYAAVLATGGAFAALFDGGSGRVLVVMLGAALAAGLVASTGKKLLALLPPAAATYTLLAVYAAPLWQNPLSAFQTDLTRALAVMYAQPVPYEPLPGLLVLLIPAAMTVSVLATSATLYGKRPVVSVALLGVTLGALSTASFERGIGPYFAVFLCAGVALLLFTGGEGPGRVGLRGVVATALVAAAVLVLPAMPSSEAILRPGLVDWDQIGWTQSGGDSRLAAGSDVGEYYNSARDTELLRVQSPEPLLWRARTLDRFDGARWSSTVEPGEDDSREVAPGVRTQTVEQRVEVLDASTSLVFGGYEITRVSLEGAKRASDGSWSVQDPLTRGSTYEVHSQVPRPTAAQLRGAGTDYPEAVQQKYLQLPEDPPAEIAETAEKIERDYDNSTPYDAARAMERYLLYDGGFTYDLNTEYRRPETALAQFLGEGRRGFCVQFATSMALVLRQMDIPARFVYGAAQGEEVGEDEYVVRGRNMHTWVEVYFPGVGWYPFDPTPGRGVTASMQESAPGSEPSTPRENTLQENTPQKGSSAVGSGTSGKAAEPAWPAYLLAPLVLGLWVCVGPLAKRAPLLRGRPEDLYRDLTARTRDVLPPGAGPSVARSPSLTPTEHLLGLAAAAGLEEEPFRKFARAYSEYLYAAHPKTGTTGAYRAALRAYRELPLWRRCLGALNPASLLERVGMIPTPPAGSTDTSSSK